VGHQVNFFILPSDLAEMEAEVRKVGDVMMLRDRTAAPEPTELTTLSIGPGDMGKVALRVYLVRPKDRELVQTRWIEQQRHWIIDQFGSPIVEFDRPFFDGVAFRPGRAYFASGGKFGHAGRSTEFVRWGNRILASIRKSIIRTPQISSFAMYASPQALEWINQPDVSGGELGFRRAAPS
jgi:hypothetical protein